MRQRDPDTFEPLQFYQFAAFGIALCAAVACTADPPAKQPAVDFPAVPAATSDAVPEHSILRQLVNSVGLPASQLTALVGEPVEPVMVEPTFRAPCPNGTNPPKTFLCNCEARTYRMDGYGITATVIDGRVRALYVENLPYLYRQPSKVVALLELPELRNAMPEVAEGEGYATYTWGGCRGRVGVAPSQRPLQLTYEVFESEHRAVLRVVDATFASGPIVPQSLALIAKDFPEDVIGKEGPGLRDRLSGYAMSIAQKFPNHKACRSSAELAVIVLLLRSVPEPLRQSKDYAVAIARAERCRSAALSVLRKEMSKLQRAVATNTAAEFDELLREYGGRAKVAAGVLTLVVPGATESFVAEHFRASLTQFQFARLTKVRYDDGGLWSYTFRVPDPDPDESMIRKTLVDLGLEVPLVSSSGGKQ